MKSTALLLCALALAACSHKAPEPQAPAANPDTARVAAPWDGMKQAEDRARDVQKTVDQQAAEQRRQTEAVDQ